MTESYLADDTICAISTPAGSGAIGIVRISGANAISIAGTYITLFHHDSFANLPVQKSAFGMFQDDKNPVDQVMAIIFRSPHSYTGEDLVEISCHGNPLILKTVLSCLMKKGARLAAAGEFSQRAYLNGKMDLAQAEAVADLIQAKTERSRAVALAQLSGTLSHGIAQIRANLIETLSHIEVKIDHSDDSTVGATLSAKNIAEHLAQAFTQVHDLIRSYSTGRIIHDGVKIVIVGKPNAGKSSLLNAMVQSDRAIVTEFPGTTRDTIEEHFDLNGIQTVMIDTAGIRTETSDPVEKIGVERSLKILKQADITLVVLDASSDFSDEDLKISQLVGHKERLLIVLSKSDLPGKIDMEKIKSKFPWRESVPVSAMIGEGIADLKKKLYQLVETLVAGKGHEDPVLITSLRHFHALVKTQECLKRAEMLVDHNEIEECLALEIREALDALGEITGETSLEDILNEVFSKFCIGK